MISKKKPLRRQETPIGAYLFRSHGTLRGLPELLDGLRVSPEILLAPNKNDGETGTEMCDLRVPLQTKKEYN